MTTRPGRHYQSTMDGEHESTRWIPKPGFTEAGSGGDAGPAGQPPPLGEMMAIFHLLKEMEGQRERAAAEECTRQREEFEHREWEAEEAAG